jgi:hypothetical protein
MKKLRNEPIQPKIGMRVEHKEYGLGTVFFVQNETNFGIRFDKGGPQGWAMDSNHDVRELAVAQ